MLDKWKFYYTDIMFGGSQLSKKWQPISKEEIKSAYKQYYEQAVLKDSDYNDNQDLDENSYE